MLHRPSMMRARRHASRALLPLAIAFGIGCAARPATVIPMPPVHPVHRMRPAPPVPPVLTEGASAVARTTPAWAPLDAPERPRQVIWIDFSAGLVGAIIGALVARHNCDPGAYECGPDIAIGGGLGAAGGLLLVRVLRGRE